MTKSPSFRDFYQRWVAEFESLRLSANQRHDDFWEGAMAYKELTTSVNWLPVLVPLTDLNLPVTSLFELLWLEIEGYRRLAGQIVSRNHEFPAAASVLAGILDELEDLETT